MNCTDLKYLTIFRLDFSFYNKCSKNIEIRKFIIKFFGKCTEFCLRHFSMPKNAFPKIIPKIPQNPPKIVQNRGRSGSGRNSIIFQNPTNFRNHCHFPSLNFHKYNPSSSTFSPLVLAFFSSDSSPKNR